MISDSDPTLRLLTVLLAEERLYGEMRSLLQEEREILYALDAIALEECVAKKEALAEEGRLLEESRIAVVMDLAKTLHLDERPTLSQLCDALGEEAGPLREVHTRLVALIGAVRELIDANASFAGDSLSQVRNTLRLLGRMMPNEPTYRPGMTAKEERVSAGNVVRRSA